MVEVVLYQQRSALSRSICRRICHPEAATSGVPLCSSRCQGRGLGIELVNTRQCSDGVCGTHGERLQLPRERAAKHPKAKHSLEWRGSRSTWQLSSPMCVKSNADTANCGLPVAGYVYVYF
ncbi:hypothetical protein WJX72_006889 [[Myrmecia] bisecta]|uniref:Uncharacterized protein n=1 Tax=[Myrmecia] bisecta TaxID=41462 RepID=A0AAW1PE16_9CHLO